MSDAAVTAKGSIVHHFNMAAAALDSVTNEVKNVVVTEAHMTWLDTAKFVLSVLNYPVFELEGFPVTLGKLVFGILLLVIGFVVSRRLSVEVDRRVYVRLNLEPALRYTFRRLTYYFFLSLSFLFTLRTLHVPLTAFTVMGGALAVGVGFGSQNLVNNFISGLLVMAEQPIRVGDYVEVAGISGRVQVIGIRSTWVRTLSNTLVVIPNTTFIEKTLTNWTLSGSISMSVRITVPYGTDTEKLKETALVAAAEVSGVSGAPAPSLTFVNFGEWGLVFDIGYYIEAQSFPSKGGIESEVRFRLNRGLAAAGIPLAIPRSEIRVDMGGVRLG